MCSLLNGIKCLFHENQLRWNVSAGVGYRRDNQSARQSCTKWSSPIESLHCVGFPSIHWRDFHLLYRLKLSVDVVSYYKWIRVASGNHLNIFLIINDERYPSVTNIEMPTIWRQSWYYYGVLGCKILRREWLWRLVSKLGNANSLFGKRK